MAPFVPNLRLVSPSVSRLGRRRIALLFDSPRWGHVASSGDSGAVARDSTPESEPKAQVDKNDEKREQPRPNNNWAPDPETGFYRPIDAETEARENANALKRKE